MELKKDHEYRLRNGVIVKWLGRGPGGRVLVLSIPPKIREKCRENPHVWRVGQARTLLGDGSGGDYGKKYDIIEEIKDWRGILKDVSGKLKADDFEFVDKLMSFLVLAYQKSNEEQKLKIREIIKNKISVLELMRDA